MNLLYPSDIYLLTDRESIFPYIIKPGSFPLLGSNVSQEIREFYDLHSELFEQTAVGRNDNRIFAPDSRGDLRCWLSPNICKEYGLNKTMELAKCLMNTCKTLKCELQLNGNYSIQVTKYVSDALLLRYYYFIILIPQVAWSWKPLRSTS
jgi:hypothetical protein